MHPLEFYTNRGTLKYNVWDTAGQEKFGGLRDGYYIQGNMDAAVWCSWPFFIVVSDVDMCCRRCPVRLLSCYKNMDMCCRWFPVRLLSFYKKMDMCCRRCPVRLLSCYKNMDMCCRWFPVRLLSCYVNMAILVWFLNILN